MHVNTNWSQQHKDEVCMTYETMNNLCILQRSNDTTHELLLGWGLHHHNLVNLMSNKRQYIYVIRSVMLRSQGGNLLRRLINKKNAYIQVSQLPRTA